MWWLWRLGPEQHYAADMLPGLLLTGMGVGLTITSLSSAAAASLPPARFATGSAVLTMSRQLGTVLGVSLLVAILGTSAGADAFDDGYTFMAAAAVLAGLTAFAIGDVRAPALTPQPAAVQPVAGD